MSAENYWAVRDLLGAAIEASDGSIEAITEIMRGVGCGVFSRMDRADNHAGVPRWHAPLRQWRNARSDYVQILNHPGDAA